ncbi:MAG: PKD-like domain-containing protein, partial [Bacteroidota bacterium]
MKIEISVVKIVAFLIICLISHFSRGSNISRFTTSTPIICGTSTNYNIDSVGLDSFSAPYQWQFVNSNDSTLLALNDVTTKTLGNQTQSIQYKLWRRISRVGTANPDTSNWVLVSMNTPTLTNASTANICSGASTNITLSASTSSTFAWTLGTNTGSISGASANNGSSINQILTNPSNAIAGSIIYNITPTSTSGSCVGATAPITVTVNPKPTVTNSNSATICSGTSPNLPLTASATSTFVWTLGTNTGSISGASSNNGSSINQTLTNPSNAIAGSIIFNVIPTSAVGSCAGTSFPITVTVNPTPSVTNSNSASICSGTSPNISLTASATSTFVWTLGTNIGSISGASANNGSSINQTLTNPSNAIVGSIIYNVIPTSTAGLCAGSSTPLTISVNPTPTVTNSNTNTICTGTSSSLSLTASTTSTFLWTLGTNTGSISGASASNGSTINQTLTNPSNASAGSIIYNVTPTSTVGLCVGASSPITVNVLPRPIMTGATSQTICSGISSLISLTSTTTGGSNTFTWNTLGNSNLSGFNTSGTTSQIGSHTISNGATTPQNLVYSITPSFTLNSVTCAGTSSNYTYTLNPIPVVNSFSSQTVCSGVSSSVALTGNTSGGSNSFIWSTLGNSNLSGFNVSGTSNQIGSHIILNGATTPQNLVYSITPTFTNNSVSCTGSSANYTYTVNPLPSINSASSQTVCSNVSSS